MTPSLVLLMVCSALLALLVLALVLFTQRAWWLKLVALVLVAGFALLGRDSLTGMLGYPTPGRLPGYFQFHQAVVAAPNKTTGEKGAIYLWATTLEPDGPAAEPRAYELPYDKDMAKLLGESQRRVREGVAQLGRRVDGESRDGLGLLTRLFSNTRTVSVVMHDLTDPALPEK